MNKLIFVIVFCFVESSYAQTLKQPEHLWYDSLANIGTRDEFSVSFKVLDNYGIVEKIIKATMYRYENLERQDGGGIWEYFDAKGRLVGQVYIMRDSLEYHVEYKKGKIHSITRDIMRKQVPETPANISKSVFMETTIYRNGKPKRVIQFDVGRDKIMTHEY